MAKKSDKMRPRARRVSMREMVFGQLQRFDEDWVYILVEHQGRTIYAVFRRDEVDRTGAENDMMVIKPTVVRKRQDKDEEVPVKPFNTSWVKRRHQNFVLLPKAVMQSIIEQAAQTTIEISRW